MARQCDRQECFMKPSLGKTVQEKAQEMRWPGDSSESGGSGRQGRTVNGVRRDVLWEPAVQRVRRIGSPPFPDKGAPVSASSQVGSAGPGRSRATGNGVGPAAKCSYAVWPAPTLVLARPRRWATGFPDFANEYR